jgi:hypothetical protein
MVPRKTPPNRQGHERKRYAKPDHQGYQVIDRDNASPIIGPMAASLAHTLLFALGRILATRLRRRQACQAATVSGAERSRIGVSPGAAESAHDNPKIRQDVNVSRLSPCSVDSIRTMDGAFLRPACTRSAETQAEVALGSPISAPCS